MRYPHTISGMTITTFPAPSRAADSAAIVARNLKRLMVERDVKQGQLAAVLGITQSNVSKRLKGQTPFTTDDLDALAQAFGVRPSELLADAGQNEAARTSEEVRAAGQLPRLDSNQQPAGRFSVLVSPGFRGKIVSLCTRRIRRGRRREDTDRSPVPICTRPGRGGAPSPLLRVVQDHRTFGHESRNPDRRAA
jgi:transcriptional regulator with XRE-family HTH domain